MFCTRKILTAETAENGEIEVQRSAKRLNELLKHRKVVRKFLEDKNAYVIIFNRIMVLFDA